MSRILFLLIVFVAGCATPPPPKPVAECPATPACAACPASTVAESEPEKPLQAADWTQLPGWQADQTLVAFRAFVAECDRIESQPLWNATCAAARTAPVTDDETARAWFEGAFRPWVLVNPDGTRDGMVTGYYEPLLKGSRKNKRPYLSPLFGPPDDLVVVDLAEVYPELKSMRLRGRIEGRKLVPYYTRAEWSEQEASRAGAALMWIDDPLDLFFMQIQGSGQVQLDDGSRVRVSYADQNGHPFKSIGRWLIDQGEITLGQASMQGIKAWARSHPKRLQEMLNANPSLVFFREVPADGSGPPGALGVPLTPERSVAIDPRIVTLGAPVWLDTTWPNDDKPLQRLMLAQDTGGAIRGAVRADFYWGSGADAGALAGKMRQRGSMWVLMPRDWSPK